LVHSASPQHSLEPKDRTMSKPVPVTLMPLPSPPADASLCERWRLVGVVLERKLSLDAFLRLVEAHELMAAGVAMMPPLVTPPPPHRRPKAPPAAQLSLPLGDRPRAVCRPRRSWRHRR